MKKIDTTIYVRYVGFESLAIVKYSKSISSSENLDNVMAVCGLVHNKAFYCFVGKNRRCQGQKNQVREMCSSIVQTLKN